MHIFIIILKYMYSLFKNMNINGYIFSILFSNKIFILVTFSTQLQRNFLIYGIYYYIFVYSQINFVNDNLSHYYYMGQLIAYFPKYTHCSLYSVNQWQNLKWFCVFSSTSYKRMPYGICVLFPFFSKWYQ